MHKLKLAGVIFLALVLRLWGLGWGLPSQSKPVCYYPDDYTVVWLLSNMNPSRLDFNPKYFHNPTFFYYQVGAVLKAASLLGILPKNQDKQYYQENRNEYTKLYFIGRLLVVLYSLMALMVVYLIGRKLYSPPVALWSSFLWAVLPIAVYSSKCLEVSTPLVFWSGAFIYACFISIERRSVRYLRVSAVLFGLMISTKYLTMPMIIPYLLAHYYVKDKPFSAELFKMAFFSLVAFFLTSPYVVLDFKSAVEGFLFSYNASGIQQGNGWNFGPIHLGYTMGWPVFFCSIIALSVMLYQKDKKTILLVSFLLPYIFLLSMAKKQVTRYYLIPVFFLIPYAGYVLSNVWNKTLMRRIIVIALLAPTILYTLARTLPLYQPDPRETSSDWIKGNIPQGSSIGTIAEPLWYTPGILFTEYRKQIGKEAGVSIFRFVIEDANNEFLWKESQPDYVVLNDDEWRMHLINPKEKTMQWPIEIPGYEQVKTFRQRQHVGPLVFEKKGYQATEWFHQFPSITIWKRVAP